MAFTGFLPYSASFLLLLALPLSPASAAPVQANTNGADVRPVLVELFTSEGCSSCPPADAMLEKMDSSSPVPSEQLVVLSEHVDYWDHDGWKDPNSSAAFTERQQEYVHAMKLDSPYTPQLIVDGTTVLKNGDYAQWDKTFQDEAAVPKSPVHITDISIDPGTPSVLKARIQADGSSLPRNAEVWVAVALNHVQSEVLHGENGGKRLTHVAVVTQLTKLGKLSKGKQFDEPVDLKLKSGVDTNNVRIVAFVQESGPGRVLGAAMRKVAN